jgi:integrase
MIEHVTFGPADAKRLPCRPGDERTEYLEVASGLRLRVTRAGARTWAVAYWSPVTKTTRRLKIGDAATMPLSKARAAARAALHGVAEEARDPYAERVAARERERAERARRAEERRRTSAERERRSRQRTFGHVLERYVAERRTTASGRFNRPASKNTLLNWSASLKLYVLPAIGSRQPHTITAEDLLSVLESAVRRGGPTVGPRVRELLSAAWRWMEQRPRALGVELPPVSPLVGLLKVGAAVRERDRVLSPGELWRFWRAAETEGLAGEALRFSLLTAARVREAVNLPWSEVDLQAALWRLPAERNKSARPRVVPLSTAAVQLLQRVQGKGDGTRVFRTPDPEGMDRLRAATGGAPWQARDLRRTAATLCARLGADPFVVALVLGHARPDERMPAVTRTYLRWDYEDRVRDALERLGAWISDTVAADREPGDVLAFAASRS